MESAARLVDVSPEGLGIETTSRLEVGVLLQVTGEVQNLQGITPLRARARVRWCSPVLGGRYYAGLLLEAHDSPPQEPVHAASGELDLYDVLQLSSKADSDTIHRVYRILAQRYHPDNAGTGNEAMFKQLLHAYEQLSDPVRRASYDAQTGGRKSTRLELFGNWKESTGVTAERRKRQGLLAGLYHRRVREPNQASMTIRELEEMLGCPREHLEFGLWYLRENGCISRSDRGRIEITAKGVDLAENFEQDGHPTGLLGLPAPAGT